MNSISEMTGLLQELLGESRQLLSLSYKKREIILTDDTGALSELLREEQLYLSKIAAFEKRRAGIAAAISKELGAKESELTMSVLIDAAEGAQKTLLRELKKELSAVLLAQSDVNRECKKLLESKLDYTETMINTILSPEGPVNNFYGGDGRSEIETCRNPGLFDTQI